MKGKRIKILIVDDDPEIIWVLKESLQEEGYYVFSADNGEAGLKILKEKSPEVILLDIKMPKMDGLQMLSMINENEHNPEVIMLSAHGEAQNIVKAMKAGASDFISKPFDTEELKITINKVLEKKELKEECAVLKQKLENTSQYENFIGDSTFMLNVKKMVEQVADTELTILVRGASGTGKELVTRSIHNLSKRRDKPFIKVNCAALPENLLESELFGYERGAFTGAQRPKPGRFEFANEGTIFLDEIGELPGSLQAKLLQVLEEKEFSRLGGKKNIKVDVRIIVATNRNLEEGIRNGGFREDLFYRLNEVAIHLPPLKEHKEDIPLLINFFMNKYRTLYNKPEVKISPYIMDLIMGYDWPGNVRQLENLIKKLIVLGDESIVHTVIPSGIEVEKMTNQSVKIIPLREINRMAVYKAEKASIKNVLNKTNWNRIQAAKLLKVSYRSLLSKIKEYEISP
ncbi:MAG: sigma-54-dependent transcriptional regulator [bacterium]